MASYAPGHESASLSQGTACIVPDDPAYYNTHQRRLQILLYQIQSNNTKNGSKTESEVANSPLLWHWSLDHSYRNIKSLLWRGAGVEEFTPAVKPRLREVLKDWENLFVISGVRCIKNLDLTNFWENKQNVRYNEE